MLEEKTSGKVWEEAAIGLQNSEWSLEKFGQTLRKFFRRIEKSL